jgi:hypothetical protein
MWTTMKNNLLGGKKVTENKVSVLIFSTNFVWNISRSKYRVLTLEVDLMDRNLI